MSARARSASGRALTLDRPVGERYTVNLTATDSAGIGAIIAVVIEVAKASHVTHTTSTAAATIERDEVVAAVQDYFDGLITKDVTLSSW